MFVEAINAQSTYIKNAFATRSDSGGTYYM